VQRVRRVDDSREADPSEGHVGQPDRQEGRLHRLLRPRQTRGQARAATHQLRGHPTADLARPSGHHLAPTSIRETSDTHGTPRRSRGHLFTLTAATTPRTCPSSGMPETLLEVPFASHPVRLVTNGPVSEPVATFVEVALH